MIIDITKKIGYYKYQNKMSCALFYVAHLKKIFKATNHLHYRFNLSSNKNAKPYQETERYNANDLTVFNAHVKVQVGLRQVFDNPPLA